LTGLAADSMTYHKAMCVPLAGFFVSFVFPIYLNTICAKELDGFRETKIGYHDERRGTVIGDINDVEGMREWEKRVSTGVHEEKV
jgi:MFS transporter, FHS family, L-fucose permease